VERLLGDGGIVRHRGKIEATIGNARAFLAIEEREGFATFLWKHVGGLPLQNAFVSLAEVPAETAVSRAMSKDLSQAGFRFCGPTIVYAFMQATGMVNDHLVTCPRHAPVARMGGAPPN
jgi:DNA-3-methyladenine glycosylase I